MGNPPVPVGIYRSTVAVPVIVLPVTLPSQAVSSAVDLNVRKSPVVNFNPDAEKVRER